MTSHSETLDTFRLPFGLTKTQLWEWGYRILILFGFLGLFYLRTTFASTESVKVIELKVAPLIEGQETIKEKVAVLEANQRSAAAMIQEIRVDLAAIKAGQAEAQRANERNFDQVLRRLDRTTPRQPGSP